MSMLDNRTVAKPVRTGSQCGSETTNFNIFYASFLSLVLVFALIGNTAVSWTVAQSRRLNKIRTYYFVFSLALSDICVALFVLPFRIYSTVNNQSFCIGLSWCIFHMVADIISSVSSVTNLMVIAVDRYMFLHFPYKYPFLMTHKRGIIAAVTVWVYSLLWGATSMIKWHAIPVDGLSLSATVKDEKCINKNPLYITALMASVFFIPLLFMAFLYYRIWKMAKSHSKSIRQNLVAQDVNDCLANGVDKDHQKRDRKALKTLAIVFGAFNICWLPNCILGITSIWCPLCFARLREYSTDLFLFLYITFVEILPPLNSALNPLIYGIYNKQFRKAFKETVINSRARSQSLFTDKSVLLTREKMPMRTPVTSNGLNLSPLRQRLITGQKVQFNDFKVTGV